MSTLQSDSDLFGARQAKRVSAQQLPLPLVWSDRAAQGGFLVGESNEDAVRYILAPETWTLPVTWLTGPAGCGKSHLGGLFTARTGGDVVEYHDVTDDETVFHAWNRALGNGLPMLLISRDDRLVDHVQLPDLRTRLASTPHVTIGLPDARMSAVLLERLLADRGLAISAKLADYVVRRIERSYDAIHATASAIDASAMASGRVLGEAMVRDVLVAARLMETGDDARTTE